MEPDGDYRFTNPGCGPLAGRVILACIFLAIAFSISGCDESSADRYLDAIRDGDQTALFILDVMDRVSDFGRSIYGYR